jgi:hypothetical protein
MSPSFAPSALRRGRRLIITAIAGLAAVRLAAAVWAARTSIYGDYYASLPGTYVKRVNPVLWDSPDMRNAMGYHLDTYYHGPTQYLTLYPVAYLDSYTAIAAVLQPIYTVALAVALFCLYKALKPLAGSRSIGAPLFASTFLFFPLLQAYIQREFEVPIFLMLSVAMLMLMRGHQAIAGALLGYVAWFKYVPLLFAGLLGLRRWWTAVAAFAGVSIAVLLVTHLVFGLPEFVNNNVPGHAGQVLRVWDYSFYPDKAGELVGAGFCQGWFESETTLANIRHGFCTIAAAVPWFAPHIVYLLLCAAIAAAYLVTHARLSRSPNASPWQTPLEFSIVTTVCACFFFAHYYYLIVLALPFAVLLTRYLSTDEHGKLALWVLAYVLISAFVIPTGILSRLAGIDVWAAFITGGWFLYGELLLVGLLMWEYWQLGVRARTVTIS